MNILRILTAVTILLLTAFTAEAQQAFSCKWVGNQSGNSYFNHHWSLKGTQSRRLTFLQLKWLNVPGKGLDYRLVGKGTWEDIGTWNLNATLIAPGRYRVHFSWPYRQSFIQTWNLPKFIVSGSNLRVTYLLLNRRLNNGVMEGRISFNRSDTQSTRHRVWLTPRVR